MGAWLGQKFGGPLMKNPAILVAILPMLCIFGCGKKNDDYGQKLSIMIPIGTAQGDAEHILDQYGFTHSFDPKRQTIYAMRRGEKTVLVRQDWSAELKLDDQRKVTSVKVEKLFTGP